MSAIDGTYLHFVRDTMPGVSPAVFWAHLTPHDSRPRVTSARWYVVAIDKAGTIGMIGVYPLTAQHAPPNVVDPSRVLTQETGPPSGALDAYEDFKPAAKDSRSRKNDKT